MWLPSRWHAASVCCAILALGACHKAPPVNEPKVADQDEMATSASGPQRKKTGEGVSLSHDQMEKMGVVVAPAKSVAYTAETQGFGAIMLHEAIATAVAELATAEAAERQSRAALARSQRLARTPGAAAADLDEAAARQSAADTAALALARRRLSAVIGSAAAVRPEGHPATLRDLADGKTKLLRATFPLGALQGAAPKSLRATPLDANPGAVEWTSKAVWNAPTDADLPGRSFFALLQGTGASEGERLLVWAPASAPALPGVLVPTAAVVISEGRYWCYIETKPGVYLRVEVDTSRPWADGYFVADRIAAGAKIVTTGAGLLLAEETNPTAGAD
jgi:cobalt-zinc-cadmium efflux system membrane fusion protein